MEGGEEGKGGGGREEAAELRLSKPGRIRALKSACSGRLLRDRPIAALTPPSLAQPIHGDGLAKYPRRLPDYQTVTQSIHEVTVTVKMAAVSHQTIPSEKIPADCHNDALSEKLTDSESQEFKF